MGQDDYIGSVAMFAGDFVPPGWALCDGSQLPIATNAALYSIIGTRYGGDGITYFKLPNFTGAFPTGMVQGSASQPRTKAAFSANQPGSVLLNQSDVPPLAATFTGTQTTVKGPVTLNASTQSGANVPTAGALLGAGGGGSGAADIYVSPTAEGTQVALGGASVSLPVTPQGTVAILRPPGQTAVQPPFVEILFCICVQGLYPIRP